MRITVELKPENRNALLALAARQGRSGLSELINEAIEIYLQGEADRERRQQAFEAWARSLNESEAEELAHNVRQIRSSWR